MAEAPFAHVFPELGVVDLFTTLADRRLLIVNVDDQAFVLGPGLAVVG